ncbi:putative F-box/LRR-repeat protein at5g02930 [Phtheirospermum japonicum]|uniref:Putative F-box/LRR-repeat protein at5g02930 n=1 Tax=Phtheirospermum japonicum TaxID=374723 RepID=A0A830B3S1_9LAMI|nr:putative F-box/LRR-repeat protein at5g02930 [Phtheirospermum japonicum]
MNVSEGSKRRYFAIRRHFKNTGYVPVKLNILVDGIENGEYSSMESEKSMVKTMMEQFKQLRKDELVLDIGRSNPKIDALLMRIHKQSSVEQENGKGCSKDDEIRFDERSSLFETKLSSQVVGNYICDDGAGGKVGAVLTQAAELCCRERVYCFDHKIQFRSKVKQSAATAVLSKRWRYLWTESPSLIFRDTSCTPQKFCKFVNRALVTRSRAPLEAFLVDFKYAKPFAPDVNAWVRFAVNTRVKRVGFLLNMTDFYYELPELMCSNSSLERLDIKGCTIAPQRTIDWPSLTKLHIKEVEVQQHMIAKILSACPVLSQFGLKKCWGFNCLEIKSKGLSDIGICDRDYKGNGPLLEISAPYIRFLSVALYPKGRKLRLTNIPSNVTATIDFIGSDLDSEESTSRTSLTLSTDREERGNIHGILGLLESSPNLDEFVVEDEDFAEEPYSCPAPKGDLDRNLLQLKTVIIKNFVAPNLADPAGKQMLKLARNLLKMVTILEKVVIYVEEFAKSSSIFDPL